METNSAQLVKKLQSSMVAEAESCFDESELDHLRTVIRLTAEFRNYVEHGNVKIAQGLLQGPHAEFVKDAQSASQDRFNKYDLEWAVGSIRSGVDSFCSLNSTYRILADTVDSQIEWGIISSREM